MHISSLPSAYGIGTLGKAAFRFLDFLADAGFRYWQVLPLGPTGFGDSPYMSFSSFAGNPYFIDLDLLCNEGLLKKAAVNAVDFGNNSARCDYGKLYENREKVLQLAFDNFLKSGNIQTAVNFLTDTFGALYKQIENYCIYCAMKKIFHCNWFEMPDKIKFLEKAAVAEFKAEHRSEIDFNLFVQYLFFKQYFQLKQIANERGIKIIGDLPFYSPYESADCFFNRDYFALDENAKLQFVGGCPPDAFSDDGQYWGMPTYRWDELRNRNYDFLVQRFEFALKLFDIVRLDHFRGFQAFWKIDAREKTARNGCWEGACGAELFTTLQRKFGTLPIIVEDLGFITEDVINLRKNFDFPGMKVLQFAFGGGSDNPYLPHNFEDTRSVVYTGTHDNDTTLGWLQAAAPDCTRHAMDYLAAGSLSAAADVFMRLTLSCVSRVAIIPVQDLLRLDNSARMNTPGTIGNWQWRMTARQLQSLSKKSGAIKKLLQLYGRCD